ncbi:MULTISPECIES: hypothetical protein [Cupriavidus]
MPSTAQRTAARSPPRSTPPTPEPLARRRVLATLTQRFFMRCHAALLALWALSIGVLASKLLWMAGVDALPLRYGLATAAAYLALLLGLRGWLAYVGLSPLLRAGRGTGKTDKADLAGDAADLLADLPLSISGGGARGAASAVAGRGGTFDGGGASGDFATDAGSGAGKALGLAGDADDALGLILLVLSLLLAALLGAFYVASQGPLLLAEVAFEALLAGGMVKVARRADQADWLRAAVRRSALPALLVCVLAVGLGFALQHWFPGKPSLVHVLRGR